MKLLRALEAAEYLNVPLRTFYYLAQGGKFARYVISPRVIRYEQADLDKFLQSCRFDPQNFRTAGSKPKTVNIKVSNPNDASRDLLECFRRAGVKIKPELLRKKI